jgi:hypothetical protein
VAKTSKTSTPSARRTKKTGRKPVKKAVVRPSTTRSTAGPGFDFEDRVAAWLLLKALTGQSLPGIGGTAARLQMQVEALGWHIDDILLTSPAAPDGPRQLAMSCKSNAQVTNSGLPADFVARCWRQWFKPDPNPVQRGKDSLALRAARTPPSWRHGAKSRTQHLEMTWRLRLAVCALHPSSRRCSIA